MGEREGMFLWELALVGSERHLMMKVCICMRTYFFSMVEIWGGGNVEILQSLLAVPYHMDHRQSLGTTQRDIL
jgi:hypothetical protein